MGQCPQSGVGVFRVLFLVKQTALGHLNVPVTELIPDKVKDLLYGDTELEFLHIGGYIADQIV